ncbi:MAG: KUP/HAK/KT family potassium transporter [Myxococcota bacterium]|nr:KUP/HAK/KT family potassium transporter [Myxococcota bacterium]
MGRPRNGPSLVATALGAVGVVFGDIGTSPLYTLQVAAHAGGARPFERADVLGVVSLVLWALLFAVSIKYVGLVMRADNDGEGGILALLALLPERPKGASIGVTALLVIAGASLLFGDGMITPAISVLSALEGLTLAAPGFQRYVVPMTCAVLLVLFAIQRRGTSSVGKLFGPVMVLWFFTIGGLGLKEIVKTPEVVCAMSPLWGARYFGRHGLAGMGVLGVVVLAITGGEALYADMGHFGARPIRTSWFGLVFPALALSYLGQGALILREPSAAANPFFAMVPKGPPTFALVALAAAATTIASQALISGVFSLTHQAVQLGYFPRVTVKHTSREAEGQIYVPLVNWGLMIACLALVVGFQASSRLASAYGIAVSGTMAITSVVFFEVTRKTWKWPASRSIPLLLFFLSFDVPFVVANAFKFVDGGYIPILVGAVFFVIMLDWHTGRQLLKERVELRSLDLAEFLAMPAAKGMARVPGTAIYLSSTPRVPHVLRQQVELLRSCVANVVLLTVVIEHAPQVDDAARCRVKMLGYGFVGVTIHFGYLESSNVPAALERAFDHGGPFATNDLGIHLEGATYYVARETVTGGSGGKMSVLPERLFGFLARNAKSPVDHFGLPEAHVVEFGSRVDL